MSKPVITFAFPESDVLAAIGRLALMSAHFDYILKMTFKSLKGISIVEALQDTNKNTGKILREKIIKLAKEKLVDSEALNELLAFIERAWKASERRNQYIHNIWARLNYSELLLQNDDLTWRPAPTKEEIEKTTYEISKVLAELNESRLMGTLSEAISKITA